MIAAALVFNALMAGLAYLIWNAQLNVYLNLSMLFVCGFNVWLLIINLIPVFPLDGGRLIQAITARSNKRLGYGFAHGLDRLGNLPVCAALAF